MFLQYKYVYHIGVLQQLHRYFSGGSGPSPPKVLHLMQLLGKSVKQGVGAPPPPGILDLPLYYFK